MPSPPLPATPGAALGRKRRRTGSAAGNSDSDDKPWHESRAKGAHKVPALADTGISHAQQAHCKSVRVPYAVPDCCCAESSATSLAKAPRPDDELGHLSFSIGDWLNNTLRIEGKLGEGTFGQVLHCVHYRKRGEPEECAVKVIRNVRKYRCAAAGEVDALRRLQGCNHCAQLHMEFDLHGHRCMVFDKLGPSLYDVLKKRHFAGFPLAFVKDVAEQLLSAVSLVHAQGLVHTDLKLENILLNTTDEANERIVQLVDFGSTADALRYHSSTVCTRHYRAPEIVIGLHWCSKIDLWSVGAILTELVLGQPLFQTHDTLEHLCMMEQVLGEMPLNLKCASRLHNDKFFDDYWKLRWHLLSQASLDALDRLTSLETLVRSSLRNEHHIDVQRFNKLLRELLVYEESARIDATEALQHPFIGYPLSNKNRARQAKASKVDEERDVA